MTAMPYDLTEAAWPPGYPIAPPVEGSSLELGTAILPEGFVWRLPTGLRRLKLGALEMGRGSIMVIPAEAEGFTLTVRKARCADWTAIVHMGTAGRRASGEAGGDGCPIHIELASLDSLHDPATRLDDPLPALETLLRGGAQTLIRHNRWSLWGLAVISAGAKGGSGLRGETGRDARPHRCWPLLDGAGRAAEPGSDGGRGGDGGWGGKITGKVLVTRNDGWHRSAFNAISIGGDAGSAGAPGMGGAGAPALTCSFGRKFPELLQGSIGHPGEAGTPGGSLPPQVAVTQTASGAFLG